MSTPGLALALALSVCASAVAQTAVAPSAAQADSDHDGINDALEQALLQRFLPRFLLSAGQCDTEPSLFLQGVGEPVALQPDGTIYGQVSRWTTTPALPEAGALLELHYYHLWQHGCGKTAHALEAGHVSALITAKSMADPANDWTALYWYASAREKAGCDKSQAARATVLQAVDGGPVVSVSAGRHGSYFSTAECQEGCEAESCEDAHPLAVPRVINLGEPGAPMNGSSWIDSGHWLIAGTDGNGDFSDGVLVSLQSPSGDRIIAAHPVSPGTQTTIATAAATANALVIAGKSTGRALDVADRHTGEALDTSARSVGNALRKAASSTGQFLSLNKPSN